jgi:hypothetical protein
MTRPTVISVAITGSLPQKANNPAVPITPEEQIESTHAAFEAGAALVHIHVRDDQGRPSSDPERFARVQEGVRKHCPGMIVQFSTGGRGRGLSERGSMLYLKPDMASLATGSVNFPTSIYENPPDFVEDLAKDMIGRGIKAEVEVFDVAMLYNAAELVKRGLLKAPAHVQFVLGLKKRAPGPARAARVPRQGARGRAPRVHLDGRRNGQEPAGREPLVTRARRPRAHRPRGQPALRRTPARGEQRGTRGTRRGNDPGIRTQRRHARGGANAARAGSLTIQHWWERT